MLGGETSYLHPQMDLRCNGYGLYGSLARSLLREIWLLILRIQWLDLMLVTLLNSVVSATVHVGKPNGEIKIRYGGLQTIIYSRLIVMLRLMREGNGGFVAAVLMNGNGRLSDGFARPVNFRSSLQKGVFAIWYACLMNRQQTGYLVFRNLLFLLGRSVLQFQI